MIYKKTNCECNDPKFIGQHPTRHCEACGKTELDVFERVAGRTNQEMIDSCQLKLDVLLQHEEVVVGRGKGRHTIKKHKFRIDEDVIERIKRSIEYYKKVEEPMKEFKFRDYQKRIIDDATVIIEQYGFVYLAMEVRTGKTFTSLGISKNFMPNGNVLFLTKKKAISSIEDDYETLGAEFLFKAINYESIHKVEGNWDVIILDEAHGLGAFPKASGRAKAVKELIANNNHPIVILLSGTPTPESYSQMYHQVYGIQENPFKKYSSFYKFAADLVNVKTKVINSMPMRDYKDGKGDIIEMMKPYTISYSQKEAGFKNEISENVLWVNIKDKTKSIIKKLKKDLVVEGKNEVILADTPVKLMMKVHQLCSGTIKFESENSMVIDYTKAEFIEEKFIGKKIAIFYKFKAELEAIKEVFDDKITTDIDEFNETDKSIALQIVSGREGISLKNAEAIVYYNIDFSATSYWQSRDRMTTKDRETSDVYWIFSVGGIESKIYDAVTKKKDYTLSHFKKNLVDLAT
jgi:hypothetical protein